MSSAAPLKPFDPSLRLLRWVVVGVAFIIILSTVASVNTFPVVTNDSLSYLGHSSDLGSYGLVNDGYRQFGYPLALALFRAAANVLTIEPLLFTSIAQRAILLAGIALSVIMWKWATAALLVFLLSASTLAYSDLILTEGLSAPLAVLLAIVFLSFTAKRTQWERSARWRLWASSAAVVLLAIWLFSIRFPFAVFGLVPIGVALISWKSTFRVPALSLLAAYIVVAASLTLAMSAENGDEYGVFFPTVRGERSAYWATWSLVFTVDAENRDDPELAGFFDDGNPYRFIGQVDASGPYTDQRAVYRSAIDDLLMAADISPLGSQLESFLWSLRGGRLDDLSGITRLITASSDEDVESIIHSNRFTDDLGVRAFSERFNGGQEPEAMLTSTSAVRVPLPDGQSSLSLLLPAGLLVLLFGVTQRQTRIEASIGLLVVVVYAAAIGIIRADNYRFLITTSAFGLVMATGVGYRLFHVLRARRRRPRPGPIRPPGVAGEATCAVAVPQLPGRGRQDAALVPGDGALQSVLERGPGREADLVPTP